MAEARRIAVLTTGRQDYGILRSTILLLRDDPRFELLLWVGGMHLKARYGRTIDLIRRDAVPVGLELDFLGDLPEPIADAARALAAVGEALDAQLPDALVLMGDRTETLAAGLAAAIRCVPIVHLHGGEESEGAIDNACRHALTKLSHLHLVSHVRHEQRVLQMGEHPEQVIVVGAAGIDNIHRDDLPSRRDLEARLGRSLDDPVVVVTLHPTTLQADPLLEVAALCSAMERVEATYVITLPNADAQGVRITDYWRSWARHRDNVIVTEALGELMYWGLMREAAAVVGNSSSGIIEAPAAGVPVVNVGDRQKGRQRFGAVLDVPADVDTIERALRTALATPRPAMASRSSAFAAVGPRIIEALAGWTPPRPPRKAFRDA